MPPKAKCSKEQIVDAAFHIVQENGMNCLSARNLAKALGISTAPIFTLFNTIEDVEREVINRAKERYAGYIREGLKQIPPFKGVGMKYIEFAKDEPELFKLLFMSGSDEVTMTHFLPCCDDHSPAVLETIEKSYGVDDEKARHLYNHMSVYAHGFAALYAQRIYVFTMQDISQMLTEVFMAMLKMS